jgi:long-chain acyl-CoA synthetase
MSGGAPLPAHVAAAYADAGLPLLEGYGLTEAAPVVCTAGRNGTVGRPLPNLAIRLGDDGELFVRGPSVMLGYWNRPDATAAVLQDDWLATGDLVSREADGSLRIVGRKSEVIVLSTGRKVWPAPLEAQLTADPFIEQAVVYGDGRASLAALVWPCWEMLDRECDWGDAAAWLQERAARLTAERASWEQVRSLTLLPRALSVEAGELTVSLKPRRSVIVARHAPMVGP